MISDFDFLYVPLDRWLLHLALGWRFSGDVAGPMPAGHGDYCCAMWRPA